jgi:hypothetical protein
VNTGVDKADSRGVDVIARGGKRKREKKEKKREKKRNEEEIEANE